MLWSSNSQVHKKPYLSLSPDQCNCSASSKASAAVCYRILVQLCGVVEGHVGYYYTGIDCAVCVNLCVCVCVRVCVCVPVRVSVSVLLVAGCGYFSHESSH